MPYLTMDSPLGNITLIGDRDYLTAIHLPGETFTLSPNLQPSPNVQPLQTAYTQLGEYFDGTRRVFDLPLNPGGTLFQQKVWQLLRRIPFGTTTSYGELAVRMGNPGACRAVGAANGRNPLPIVVPCHRVIGSNGKLTGFAGGLPAKRWLLEHEGAVVIHRKVLIGE